MLKSTPGPWEFKSDYPDQDGYKIWPPAFVRPRLVVAVVRNQDMSPALSGRANAHLIAAAPAMYEALKFVNEKCQLYGAHDSAREKIEAALKQAEGRDA